MIRPHPDRATWIECLALAMLLLLAFAVLEFLCGCGETATPAPAASVPTVRMRRYRDLWTWPPPCDHYVQIEELAPDANLFPPPTPTTFPTTAPSTQPVDGNEYQ